MSGSAIPASDIVTITPNVLSAGGTALDMIGVMLTTNPRVPIGGFLSFPSQLAVANFFGSTSQEATPVASTYFLGFDNSNKKPGAILFYQYNTAPVGAWLRGGSLAAMTLTQLQAITPGTLTISINGTPHTSSSINLSGATSFSNAAELISTALGVAGPAGAAFTGAISGTTLTVSAVSSGTLAVGQEIVGAGVTAGTQISAFLSGTGTTGTYTVTTSQTVTSESMTSDMPTVTFDPISSAFYVVSSTTGAASTISFASGPISAALALTQATGATISQGANAATPAGSMNALAAQTQDWVSFTTLFDPDGGSGSTVKQAFAAWVNAQSNRFLYVPWDTDITPTESLNAATSLGQILKSSQSSGVDVIYSPGQGPTIAAFEMGAVASIDFTEFNGRTNMDFRGQSGITPDVTNQTIAVNLRSNGYNFYGAWSTANQRFQFFNPGQMIGKFTWIDTYVNQIWLNNEFQLALMELLTQVKSIPYNAAGNTLIRAALLDVINAAGNFGVFRPGVTLSELQKAEVNAAAGFAIDGILSQQGWYLLIGVASPQVRQARGSPPCTFWYMDGESVQMINLASVVVQ